MLKRLLGFNAEQGKLIAIDGTGLNAGVGGEAILPSSPSIVREGDALLRPSNKQKANMQRRRLVGGGGFSTKAISSRLGEDGSYSFYVYNGRQWLEMPVFVATSPEYDCYYEPEAYIVSTGLGANDWLVTLLFRGIYDDTQERWADEQTIFEWSSEGNKQNWGYEYAINAVLYIAPNAENGNTAEVVQQYTGYETNGLLFAKYRGGAYCSSAMGRERPIYNSTESLPWGGLFHQMAENIYAFSNNDEIIEADETLNYQTGASQPPLGTAAFGYTPVGWGDDPDDSAGNEPYTGMSAYTPSAGDHSGVRGLKALWVNTLVEYWTYNWPQTLDAEYSPAYGVWYPEGTLTEVTLAQYNAADTKQVYKLAKSYIISPGPPEIRGTKYYLFESNQYCKLGIYEWARNLDKVIRPDIMRPTSWAWATSATVTEYIYGAQTLAGRIGGPIAGGSFSSAIAGSFTGRYSDDASRPNVLFCNKPESLTILPMQFTYSYVRISAGRNRAYYNYPLPNGQYRTTGNMSWDRTFLYINMNAQPSSIAPNFTKPCDYETTSWSFSTSRRDEINVDIRRETIWSNGTDDGINNDAPDVFSVYELLLIDKDATYSLFVHRQKSQNSEAELLYSDDAIEEAWTFYIRNNKSETEYELIAHEDLELSLTELFGSYSPEGNSNRGMYTPCHTQTQFSALLVVKGNCYLQYAEEPSIWPHKLAEQVEVMQGNEPAKLKYAQIVPDPATGTAIVKPAPRVLSPDLMLKQWQYADEPDARLHSINVYWTG